MFGFLKRKDQLKDTIKECESYSRLSGNKDFQKWKREVVEGRLEVLKNQALHIDRTKPDWEEMALQAIIQYQETKFAFDTYFEAKKAVLDHSRSELKKLSK